MNKLFPLLLLLIVFIAQGSIAFAEEHSWQHDVQPYIWFPTSVEGTSTVDGGAAKLDLDASDMADMINFAFSLRYEAWKGKFGIIVDGMYVDLEADFKDALPAPPFSPGSSVKVEPDIEQVVVDLAGAYRLDYGKWSTDLIGGLRYTYIKQEIELNFPSPVPTQDLGGSKDYVEPMVGARVIWALSDKWRATLRGDMSGFGVGSGSDLTWNALAGAAYTYSEKASIKLGYRIYDIDYSNGSGSNEFGVDLQLHGPYLGASFSF